MHSLKNKKIVVTGASSGIGAACCAALKFVGAIVTGMDINAPEEQAFDEFVEFDQGDSDSIDSAVGQLTVGIDGLMNVAGVAPSARFSPADVLRINFFGVRYLSDAILPKLKPGSSIVNMTSGTGAGWMSNIEQIKAFLALDDASIIPAFVERFGISNEGLGNSAAYPFSKQLLSVWTMKSAARMRERQLRINAVAPASVDTPIVVDFLASFGEEAAQRMAAFGSATPAMVASASVFLLSDDARWINGAVLPVDGGAIATGTMGKLGI